MSKYTLLTIIILMLCTFCSAIAVVYSQHKNRQLFVSMRTLLKEKDTLNIHYGRLQLEQSAWASYGRIEEKAINELTMRPPKLDNLKFIDIKR